MKSVQIHTWGLTMTIYFSGHKFNYEIEGIAKLFFPLMRFTHIYENDFALDEDYIITRQKIGKRSTCVWVSIKIGNIKKRMCKTISNTIDNYSNECERQLSLLLYTVLKSITRINPQWGILTGIRPVAIAQKLRKKGMTDSEISSYFNNYYLVSDEKIKLALQTADNQQHILEMSNGNSFSLYISIPFCYSRCSYCSFVSHAINTQKSTEKIDEYVRLLCVEIEYTAKLANDLGLELETIYIGGGTPTALTAQQLKQITDSISKSFDVKSAKEYTIEAGRADTITREKLEVIKQAGATRISVNPQTFNDDVLKEIGRNHTAQQAIDSFLLAEQVGFESINMDFIAGLPTDTVESFKSSIDKAIALSPSNITVHTLTIKRSSELFEKESIQTYVKDINIVEMTDYAQRELIKAGYQSYYLYRQKNTIGNLENVGYCKSGFQSLYNVYIMDEMQTILACGAGGVTKLVGKGEKSIERIFNYKYHFEYISQFDEIINRKAGVRKFYERQIQE